MDSDQNPAHQASLPGFCQAEEAVAAMAASGVEARGAVFTRPEVVGFILDLAGYTADQPLHRCRLLEPSMGQGSFLLLAINRLFEAYAQSLTGQDPAERDAVADLADCIRAVELHQTSYKAACRKVRQALVGKGLTREQAAALCKLWLVQGDFLLLSLPGTFTHVVGNPPYVRQEMIPGALVAEYRRRYRTIFDRADLYIPFIERSLSLLGEGGALGFICADRWTKNRYGGPLRRYVAENFRLRHFVDMVGTAAFQSDVVAYPAIFVISREQPGPTRVAHRPAIKAEVLRALAGAMNATDLIAGNAVLEFANVANDDHPWMLSGSDQLEMVRRIEEDFPAIEETGCRVGIGVATGADRAYIAPFEELDVEPDRKLPLVMTRDILSGTVAWRGFGVVNPFGDDGKVVPLKNYPKLAAHLERHRAVIMRRHVSRKNPGSWYRTIDRITPEVAARPKLLIPDIKGAAHIVYEPGKLYPHHNLYYITAETWDLQALQAVLMSEVTHAFIALYSTRMRGDYLRYQAQYLRRLRLPHWRDVPKALRAELGRAGQARDVAACNDAVARLYRLTPSERAALSSTPEAARAA